MARRTLTLIESTLQSQFLSALHAAGGWSYDSLCAYAAELGMTWHKGDVSRWVNGQHEAPAWFLPVLLGHLDDSEAVARVLAAPGRRYGVVVEASEEPDQPDPRDLQLLSAGLHQQVLRAAHAVMDGDTPAGAAELARDLRHMAALVDALGGRED